MLFMLYCVEYFFVLQNVSEYVGPPQPKMPFNPFQVFRFKMRFGFIV